MNRAEQILSLYRRYGDSSYGESCTVLSHSMQAGQLALSLEMDEEMILAAFLHDIGHLAPLGEGEQVEKMGDYGLQKHDQLGAEYLAQQGFSERVIAPVKWHVEAKRYLCQVFPDYYEQLSEASRITLHHQGGPMSPAEAENFERVPYYSDIIAIRKLDEMAKGTDYKITDEDWQLIADLINQHLES